MSLEVDIFKDKIPFKRSSSKKLLVAYLCDFPHPHQTNWCYLQRNCDMFEIIALLGAIETYFWDLDTFMHYHICAIRQSYKELHLIATKKNLASFGGNKKDF